MTNFIVSLPVWGTQFTKTFVELTIPMIRYAVLTAKGYCSVKLHIYTDAAGKALIDSASDGLDVEVFDLPIVSGEEWWVTLMRCHKRDLVNCPPDTLYVPFTSDMVMSKEFFLRLRQIFHDKRIKVVAGASPRAIKEKFAPREFSGEELGRWFWQNRHVTVDHCLWPDGKHLNMANMKPDWHRLFFSSGDNACCHWTMLHPFAVKGGETEYNNKLDFHPTVDCNLVGRNFGITEIYVVQKPKEFFVIELSPEDKPFAVGNVGFRELWKTGVMKVSSGVYRSLFLKRIIIQGNEADRFGDEELINHLQKGSA